MNELVNKFYWWVINLCLKYIKNGLVLLTLLVVHLTKNKERIEKFMQIENTDFISRNELDKACFQHDMAYGKSKDLAKRTQSDKVLRDKVFKTASGPK